MRAKPFYLVNGAVQRNVINQILSEPLDGTRKVSITNAGSKSAKQRGLQWMWYQDVVTSGIGGPDEGDENRLHLVSKYRWCLPIQVRDDDHFADLWLEFYNRWKGSPEKLEWFVDHHVSTEALDKSQMAEFLTKFQDHYAIDLGVNLRDPDEFGWKGLLKEAA